MNQKQFSDNRQICCPVHTFSFSVTKNNHYSKDFSALKGATNAPSFGGGESSKLSPLWWQRLAKDGRKKRVRIHSSAKRKKGGNKACSTSQSRRKWKNGESQGKEQKRQRNERAMERRSKVSCRTCSIFLRVFFFFFFVYSAFFCLFDFLFYISLGFSSSLALTKRNKRGWRNITSPE